MSSLWPGKKRLPAGSSSAALGGVEMSRFLRCSHTVNTFFETIVAILINLVGGSLVSKGSISVGDLTSLLLYTVYVGSGLQTLT